MRDTYTTTDLALAAYLVASGHPLLGLRPMSGSPRCVFEFDPEVEPAAGLYFHGAKVKAQLFANTIRDLRARARHTR